MVDRLVIRIPHLPTLKSPNRAGYWKGQARADDKETAYPYVRQAYQDVGGDCMPYFWSGPVSLALFIHYPDRRIRDNDNALATCKGFIDALVPRVIPDDNCTVIKRTTIECVLGSYREPLVEMVVEAL